VARKRAAEQDTTPRPKDPQAPKGRPTYGRKQRQAEARRRARQRMIKRRIGWTVFILAILAVMVVLVMFDIGAVTPQGL